MERLPLRAPLRLCRSVRPVSERWLNCKNFKMEKLLELPKILDARGNLTFMENQRHFPFVIERVYWTYDVSGGEIRGGHAFKTHQEVVVALRSEEHTSELQSRPHLVCRLLLEKKK